MTQYGVENVRNCILWVGRQFKLEIFCSNVYADDDGTTIFEPVNELKTLKHVKTSSCLMNMHAVTLP